MVILIVLLTPLILLGCSLVFSRLGYEVTNYKGEQTPYSLGLCLFIVMFNYFYLFKLDIVSMSFFYLTVLFITGFIDDCFGQKYPKGLKGHIHLFIRTGKMSTGLMKLVGTVGVAFFFTVFYKTSGIIDFLAIFLLLVLTPHIMNLFDTKPLRVWKITSLHGVIFIPYFLQFPLQIRVFLICVIAFFVYFEAKRKGMLGDSGATLLGGVISLIVINYFPASMQWALIFSYCFIIVVTERISLSEWIETKPLLKAIDRWGVS